MQHNTEVGEYEFICESCGYKEIRKVPTCDVVYLRTIYHCKNCESNIGAITKETKQGKSQMETEIDSGNLDVCEDCPDREKCWNKGLDIYCIAYQEQERRKEK